MSKSTSTLASKIGKPLFVLLAIWVFGFALYADMLPSPPKEEELHPVDAIVVLTGGNNRLRAAMGLLKANHGKRLLISGVHHAVSDQDMIRITQAPTELFECCVDLDHASENTIDNAQATAAWITSNQYKSFYLVTEDFHMMRSRLLIETALPDITIKPYPVKAEVPIQTLMVEYIKLSVTYVRSLIQI